MNFDYSTSGFEGILNGYINIPNEKFKSNVNTLRKEIQETTTKLVQGAFDNINQLSEDYSSRLIVRVKQIKEETTGFLAFFRYLFRREERNIKLEYADGMEKLSDFFKKIKSISFPVKAPEEMRPETRDVGVMTEPVEEIVEPKAKVEQREEVVLSQPSELNSIGTSETPLAPPIEAGPDAPLMEEGIPPAPSEDGAPPPPPDMPAISLPTLTPEEQYIKGETKKLQRKLEERSDPKNLYIITPAKNENDLLKQQAGLQEDIETFQELLLGDLATSPRSTVKRRLESKQQSLEKVIEELKGTLKPIGKDDPSFEEKMSKYTNEELKILIGMLFIDEVNIEKAEQEKVPRTHLNYASYSNNHKSLDDIFSNWKTLSEGQSGQAFLKHKEEWQRYLVANIYGVIKTLKSRNLSPTSSFYLPEPSYTIQHYQASKTKSGLPPVKNSKENTVKHEISLVAIQGIKLRKSVPISPRSPKSTTHSRLMKDLHRGFQFRTTMEKTPGSPKHQPKVTNNLKKIQEIHSK